jgi:ATP/maltotriose-dependent transcriptional regulator MalT
MKAQPTQRPSKRDKVVTCNLLGRLRGCALLNEQAWGEVAQSLRLSGREVQVVRGVFDDRKEFAIACELGIALRTVHTHIERLYRKLAVKDRVELVLRVVEAFLALTASPDSALPSICGRRTANHCPLQPSLSDPPVS